MVLYKQVILTNLKSSPADTAKVFKEFSSFILSKGGVVRDLSHRGHRTLGYAIDDRRWGGTFERHREAKMLVKTFEANPTTLKELEAKMKLSYPILRFATFKVKKDPLRDVLKAATTQSAQTTEPFNWQEFKATTDDSTKVFETDYLVEDDFDGEEVSEVVDETSEEDDADMAAWLRQKTNPDEQLEVVTSNIDEFNLDGDHSELEELEEDEDSSEDIAAWEQEERMPPTVEIPEWKRDSSYEPERPSATKK